MNPYEIGAFVPAMIDDPARPSGGNRYDRRVLDGLRALGFEVREHLIDEGDQVDELLSVLPERAVVLVDGLVASWIGRPLLAHSARLRIVLLLHMPLTEVSTRARWRSPGSTTEEGPVSTGSTTEEGPVSTDSTTEEGPVSTAPTTEEDKVLTAPTIEERLSSSAAAVITTSAWLRDEVSGPGRPAYVATPGVDAAPLTMQTLGGGRLLCVGAVLPAKGHDVLRVALDRLDPELGWHLTMVGSLEREPDFVASLRSHPRVHLAGALTGAALDASYAAADLLVLPTLAESYGMVLTEALARGIPVIASDVGGVHEAIDGPAGVLVPPGDAVALAEALRQWLTDGHHRVRLRRAAAERRRTLTSWARTARVVALALDAVRAGVSV